MGKNALCILSRRPHKGNLLFAEAIIQTGKLDVIFITDEPYTPSPDIDSRIQFIYIDDQTCADIGFKYSCKFVSFSKDVVAWDKAFYYFGCKEKSYDFVWLMEDDVFVPSTELLCKMTDIYSQFDLVMARVLTNNNVGRHWSFWHYVTPYMKEPYLCGRVCGMGASKKWFEVAAEFIKEAKRIPFIEGFVPSIAAFHQLKIVEAFELYGVANCGHQPMCPMPFHCNSFNEFTIEQFIELSKANPTILLHPIKKEEDYCKIFNEVYT